MYWIRDYIRFNDLSHPKTLTGDHVTSYLTYLACTRHVSAATQAIALNSLAFLYNKFLHQPLNNLPEFRRTHTQRKLPVVLSAVQVKRVLNPLRGVHYLLGALLYGSGLRRLEAIRLRVKDIDFDHLALRIWKGKGANHRTVTLAAQLLPLKCAVGCMPTITWLGRAELFACQYFRRPASQQTLRARCLAHRLHR